MSRALSQKAPKGPFRRVTVLSRLVLELADASSGDMRLSDHAARSMI
jgi:hypothetical protein